MNNLELRKLIENIFHWNLSDTFAKKAGLELDDGVWFKLHHPVTDQLLNLIDIPVIITINYHR